MMLGTAAIRSTTEVSGRRIGIRPSTFMGAYSLMNRAAHNDTGTATQIATSATATVPKRAASIPNLACTPFVYRWVVREEGPDPCGGRQGRAWMKMKTPIRKRTAKVMNPENFTRPRKA